MAEQREVISYCRGCEGFCGVVATVEDDRIVSVRGDRENVISLGRTCPMAEATATSLGHPTRVTQPMRREGDGWVATSWDEALSAIGEGLGSIRRSAGAEAIGVYAGNPLALHARDAVRTGAFAVGMGTPNLFSGLAQYGGPMLWVTEQMIGHAAPLQSDVGRAHYVLLLGANQRSSQWGPFMGGTIHHEGLRHAKSTKSTRVVVVDPRVTELSELADEVLQIRPGTDVYLLMALLNAVLAGQWWDAQFVEDYTEGLEELEALVAPWTPERVAPICGVETGAISGVALKFSRAAMAVAHRGMGLLNSEHATVGSWALLALHALTANLLRPGGLYENRGLLDLAPLTKHMPSRGVASRVSGIAPQGMQLPGTLLAEEILTPGEGQIKALVCVQGDPLGALPGPERVTEALDSLSLLVCLATHVDATTERADWVLPVPHFWERDGEHVHTTPILPYTFSQKTGAVVRPPEEARPVEDVLAALLRAARPPVRGSAWGLATTAAARWLTTTDLVPWEDRLWDLLAEEPRAEVAKAPHGHNVGDVDRATWRITTPTERIVLVPPALREAIAALAPPAEDPDRPLWLTSRSTTAGCRPEPGGPLEALTVEMHPEAAEARSLVAGAWAEVRSAGGMCRAQVVLDEALRADVVVIPHGWGFAVDAGARSVFPGAVIASGPADRLTGAPGWAGTRVEVVAAPV